MDFNEAEQKRIQFSTRLRSGQLSPAQFAQALTGLQVTDGRGTIWQPNPSGDGWIFWTGSAWQPGAPPGINGPGMAAGTSGQKSAKDFNEFKSSLMTVDEFKKMSKDVPLAKRPQKWWDLLSILGGVVAAILWFLYGGIRSGREGFDFITPLLMIAIPIILVWFRADIDKLLLPLQPHRKKISKIILIGFGIAIPFLTAWLLYNIFHISQYPLMQANMIVGTFAAYVITRDPQISPGRQTPRGGPVAGSAMIIFTIVLCSCFVAPVLADDCLTDPLNAQDCLRTDGYAEVMAGLVATILASLINGPIIIQSIVQGAAGAGAGVQPPAPPGGPFVGDKRDFVDYRGEQRTAVLQADGNWLTDQGTYVDLDGVDAARKQYQENQAWMADQRVKEAAETAARMDAYTKQLEAIKGQKSQDFLDFQKWYKDYLRQNQELNESMAKAYRGQADLMNTLTKGAEFTEKAADISIDILAKVTGPQGKSIKQAYTVAKDLAKNVSSSVASGEGVGKGLVKGTLEAGFDLGFDKVKESFTKGTCGKIPGFKDYAGGKFSAESSKTIEKAITQTLATGINDSLTKQNMIRDAFKDGVKNAMQSQGQKMLIKDPLKTFTGLKK